MEHCSSHASVLAKLMGFYTVEMSNLVTGDRTVANLLVMENLFFNHHITRTFDLKGIVGRRVKVNDKVETITKTLFDSEWVEGILLLTPSVCYSLTHWLRGQKINPTLINTSSNAVLLHAIRADAEFLAKNLIMDYRYEAHLRFDPS
jgi:1-phosphatidylinositol-3-phosphate 5-kinase